MGTKRIHNTTETKMMAFLRKIEDEKPYIFEKALSLVENRGCDFYPSLAIEVEKLLIEKGEWI